jgi:hypothetical protein
MKKSIAIMVVSCIALMAGGVFEQSSAEKISIDLSPAEVILGDPGQREEGVLTITKTYRYEVNTSEAEKKPVAGCTADIRKRHDLEEVVEATIKINLKAGGMVLDAIYEGTRSVSYTPVSAEITRFILNYNETEYDFRNTSGGACDSSKGFENTLTNRRVITKEPVLFGILGPDFEITFDKKTNKALRLWPRSLSITYGYCQTEAMNAREWPKNDPESSYTNSWKMDGMLLLDAVEEQDSETSDEIDAMGLREFLKGKVDKNLLNNVPDIPIYVGRPLDESRGYSDLNVTTGNGLTNFGGQGRKFNEKQIKGGTEKEELTYKWDMQLTGKK